MGGTAFISDEGKSSFIDFPCPAFSNCLGKYGRIVCYQNQTRKGSILRFA